MTDDHVDNLDLALPLTYAALVLLVLLATFVAGVIVAQLVLHGTASTEAWAAMTGIIGWVMGQAGAIYSFRFGTTRSSGAKDVLIGQLSRGKQ